MQESIMVRVETMNPKFNIDITANSVDEVKDLIDYIEKKFKTETKSDLGLTLSTSQPMTLMETMSNESAGVTASDFVISVPDSDRVEKK
ncbi:hypothetical protein CL614_10655 [archaeon]|nr:hypothetical protein [archaeon]|tara:strand:- start:526 stop:792 length:267 start_codon:yes stop_codon:yes gene_type:complete